MMPHARLQPMAPMSIARTSLAPRLGDADRAGEREHHDEAEDDLGETFERIEDAGAGGWLAHGWGESGFENRRSHRRAS